MTLLFDTTVVIDYLRGDERARSLLLSLDESPFLSAFSVAELYRGVREGRERKMLVDALAFFIIVPIDEAIAERGGLWVRQYGPSHSVSLPDALIAACAEEKAARLVTHNRKHFPMLTDVLVPY